MVVPAVLLVLNQVALILLSHSLRKRAAAVLSRRSATEAVLCASAEDSWKRMLSPDRANDTFIEDY